MYIHIAANHNMYINFNVIYHKGTYSTPPPPKKKNQNVTLSLTHSPFSHTNDIIVLLLQRSYKRSIIWKSMAFTMFALNMNHTISLI